MEGCKTISWGNEEREREGTKEEVQSKHKPEGWKVSSRSSKLQDASSKQQAASSKLQAASSRLQAAGCKLQAASCKL